MFVLCQAWLQAFSTAPLPPRPPACLPSQYTQIASLGDIEAEVRWFLQQVADVWKPAPSQDECTVTTAFVFRRPTC